MNKITLALVLGTGLTSGLTAPRAHAAPTDIQTLGTETISAGKFNGLFNPYNTAILSPFRFDGSQTDSGLIESQVFKGADGTAAQGLFAYAYQVAVSPASADKTVEPGHVDSVSFKYNGTTAGTGTNAHGFIINDGKVGGLDLAGTQVPVALSLQPGHTTNFIRAQYVDPASSGPIGAGANSATFVLLSKEMPADVKPSVNVGGGAATTTVPVAYAANAGAIEPVPVPEPATLLAWAGMAGAVALVRRIRKSRQSA